MAEAIPARFREAREYLGFTLDEAAAACMWETWLLEQLETGAVAPTPGQLLKLSKLYRRPVAWFSDEAPFTPSPELLAKVEKIRDPGDREAVLDFAEWLQGAGPPPGSRCGGEAVNGR